MGENSKISWTHHSFNPWWGCTNVSPACDLCYAEDTSNRWGFKVWGKDAPRRFFGEKHWGEPLKWNEKARKAGERRRVFCGSMCDILEEWDGTPLLDGKGVREWWTEAPPAIKTYGLDPRADWLHAARELLWALIKSTPWLDWLLLSKRPQNYFKMLPRRWRENPQHNVWIMTTVESPEYLWRLDAIAKIRAVVHGVSWEPGLAYVDFKPYAHVYNLWVIAGGESCAGCRPFDLGAARSILSDCREIGARFFMKQLGGHPFKQDDPALWPEDLRIQEFPKNGKEA